MNQDHPPTIQLTLSTAGFTGAHIDEVMPVFAADRDVTVGLKWYPCATGPETWTLVVALAGLPLAAMLKKFGELFASDLYEWAKGKLTHFFAARPNNCGFFTLELEATVIRSCEPVEVLSCEQLPSVLASVDLSTSASWEIVYDSSTGSLTITPGK